jgi:hypothetical protein
VVVVCDEYPPSGHAKFSTPRLGRRLLNQAFPLPAIHRQVAIEAARLPAYAGRYPVASQAPENRPWGMREMLIATPDGHRMMIGQQLASNS